MFRKLNIFHKVIEKRGSKISVDVMAITNTWSNQRRKRRLQKRLEQEAKKIKADDTFDQTVNINSKSVVSSNFHNDIFAQTNSKETDSNDNNNKKLKKNKNEENMSVKDKESAPMPVVHEPVNVLDKEEAMNIDTDEACNQNLNVNPKSKTTSNLLHDTIELSNYKSTDTTKNNNDETEINGNEDIMSLKDETKSMPVVHALMNIFKKDKDILMQMEFLEGTAGKEGLHQIVQYIKNNWK